MNNSSATASMTTPPIVSEPEWEAAWQQLLVKEKALTRARDALAAERRRMPWLAVEKAYAFSGPDGPATLLDLFDGRRQLVVYRAFFEPGVHGWPDHPCSGCSLVADQVAHVADLGGQDDAVVRLTRALGELGGADRALPLLRRKPARRGQRLEGARCRWGRKPRRCRQNADFRLTFTRKKP